MHRDANVSSQPWFGVADTYRDMAKLFERTNGYWSVNFRDRNRRSSHKQVSTGTTIKRDAEKIQRRLDSVYRLREHDPWHPSPSVDEVPCETLQEAVDAFIRSRSNLSPYTVKKYESVLGLLVGFVDSKTPIANVTTEHIQSFLDDGDRKPVTKKTYSTTLSPFFNWLVAGGALEESPSGDLRLTRVPTKFPQYLSPEDVEEICAAIRRSQKNKHAIDDAGAWLIPIVRSNVFLGLRAAEVVNLRWNDVKLGERRLSVGNVSFDTKSSRDRMLPLCGPVTALLGGMDRRSEWVFPNHSGRQLHRAYLSRRFKYYAREARLDESVKFHTTRHTCASWLAQRGVPVEAIRQYMGHSSIQVTQKYMHLAPETLSSAILRAFTA